MDERKHLLQELGVAVVVNPSTAEHRWDMTVRLPWAEILRRKSERSKSFSLSYMGHFISRTNDSLTEEMAQEWMEDEADPAAVKAKLLNSDIGRMKPFPQGSFRPLLREVQA